MSEWTPSTPMVRSRYVSTFAHMGAVYIYHDLYGYILQMSPDILAFLDEFAEPKKPMGVCVAYGGKFDEVEPESFVTTFAQFGCLVPAGEEETEGIWDKCPVKARWNVWIAEPDGGVTFYTAWGDRPLAKHTLTAAEAALLARFDGETVLEDLAEELDARDALRALIEKLVHHDVQAVKLSQVPLRLYKGRQHMKPPYLASTMPYASYDPATDPAPEALGQHVTPEAYYRGEIADAEAQFEQQETTLSHLFRVPHPALSGRTYGQALMDALGARSKLPESGAIRVLEIGGGLGKVAKASVEALQERGLDVSWDILELSPTLAKAQREETAGLPVQVTEGEALKDAWPGDGYDLIVSNEMIGDLPAVQLTHEEARLGDDSLQGEAYQQFLATLPGGEIVAKYQVPIGDAPDPFYLNIGAMLLVERCAGALKPGGTAVITEFGELARWPILSSHLDHPELSIHFGHLMYVSKALGLETDFAFLMDLIDMRRDLLGLNTTRSYYRALQGLLADHGVKLEKIGYTRQMFSELLAGSSIQGRLVGDLEFSPIEDRLMGLVPHEFKALLVTKPAEG